ncbi:MAG: metallophosphoesterase family protein [Clostridia bacterium]|nr:metallophosphoesterase family protein [Clostridia bacterium]
MYQHFSRPDWYLGRTGHLNAAVAEHRIGGIPAFMRGLRALFVSDVHALDSTTDADLAALTAQMMAAKPDIILLGGDYSDTRENACRVFAAWRALRAPLGLYGVKGNNDSEAWESDRALRREMAGFGCKLLVNQSAALPLAGGTLIIGGVDEHRHGCPRADGLFPARPSRKHYRILLSHYPSIPAQKPELMLSGHTHGGQFNLLGVTPYAVGFERFTRPRRASAAISGLHEIDGMRLLVSKGIGASRIQLRVCVRPEIELLTFG